MRYLLPFLLLLALLPALVRAADPAPHLTGPYMSSQGIQATVTGATSVAADGGATVELIEPGVFVLTFARPPSWIDASGPGGSLHWEQATPEAPAPTPLPARIVPQRWLPVVFKG